MNIACPDAVRATLVVVRRVAVGRCLVAAVLFGASAPLASELAGSVPAFTLAGLLYVGAAIATAPAIVGRPPSKRALRAEWRPAAAAAAPERLHITVQASGGKAAASRREEHGSAPHASFRFFPSASISPACRSPSRSRVVLPDPKPRFLTETETED